MPIQRQTSTEAMRAEIEGMLERARGKGPEKFNNMLRSQLRGCDLDTRTAEFAFPVQGWELNLMGGMHGGVIAGALDNAMGLVAHSLLPGCKLVTAGLCISYLRPVPVDNDFIVTVRAEHVGRTLVQLTCEGHIASQEPAATASATFCVVEGRENV